MQKKTVRSGLVGAGFSATLHFEPIGKVYGTDMEVVGVYAKDQMAADHVEAESC
jgi:predicted dehydrogenase